MPLHLKQNKIKGLINFCNTAPLLSNNTVVTIHDLAFARHPEWFNPKFSSWYNWLIPKIVKRAKNILTVSEFSKKEIIDHYGLSSSKVNAVPNGIYWPIEQGSDSMEYKLDKYILAVGSDNPRKNYKLLINAFEKLDQSTFKLIIVGSPSKVFSQSSKKESDKIQWLSNVDFNQLEHLYRNAHCLVMPSLYEGFGLPILEALHFNCPVVANEIQVFKEIFGDNIEYYQENDLVDLIEKLERIIRENKLNASTKNLSEKLNYKSGALKLVQILGIN